MRRVRAAIDFIEANLQDDLTLDGVAGAGRIVTLSSTTAVPGYLWRQSEGLYPQKATDRSGS